MRKITQNDLNHGGAMAGRIKRNLTADSNPMVWFVKKNKKQLADCLASPVTTPVFPWLCGSA
jgi:hypothetical protein